MTSAFSWQNCISLCPAHSTFQGQICLLLQVFLDFLLLHSSPPIMKRTSLLGVSSKRSCRFSYNRSTSASLALLVGVQPWITVILNASPWRQTEIILSLLRLHPSTAFWNLCMTVMATQFLLRDSCLHSQKRPTTPLDFLFIQLCSQLPLYIFHY